MSERWTGRHSLYDDLHICYEGFTNEIPIRVPNLSTQGMFINTVLEFPERAVLRISFLLPRTNVRIHARAEVRFCLSGVGVGVEFIKLEAEQESSIEQELSAHMRPSDSGVKDAES